jgi:hypothetical protein
MVRQSSVAPCGLDPMRPRPRSSVGPCRLDPPARRLTDRAAQRRRREYAPGDRVVQASRPRPCGRRADGPSPAAGVERSAMSPRSAAPRASAASPRPPRRPGMGPSGSIASRASAASLAARRAGVVALLDPAKPVTGERRKAVETVERPGMSSRRADRRRASGKAAHSNLDPLAPGRRAHAASGQRRKAACPHELMRASISFRAAISRPAVSPIPASGQRGSPVERVRARPLGGLSPNQPSKQTLPGYCASIAASW